MPIKKISQNETVCFNSVFTKLFDLKDINQYNLKTLVKPQKKIDPYIFMVLK
jgi:hypothetical protein